MPAIACAMRRLPSNVKGLVTIPTVSAPASRASRATTGAAPVPVPPPMPAVTNTMSASSRIFLISSIDSSAARAPICGLAPAPNPLVSFCPMASLVVASDFFSTCASVLMATNSTPLMLELIMRLTALFPPPPTPITSIFTPDELVSSCSKVICYFLPLLGLFTQACRLAAGTAPAACRN